ncbi:MULTISPECIES: exodeoxyribonuclease VII small subunit [Mobiluncus]|uniref:Exodeoxyribonuclease VII small subunit n=3 Tax=Mobiluncus TaxID=2050 RepID=D6ZK62_MOBCV|nr:MULTISPECIES: exodeoxyribonuclease VII small subunit [Mobiluncus]ADI67111.1 exodeoxyribonuclease VII, small subunit [Mobiluncus curtisii ATCC 43063]EFU81666.1 exodeoxyribonuclease VII, small subunit [Mobiluncus holmesii ATCC 35242]MCV0000316.1 exodeoxyribonuclease VII small subunit [Mobiluncus curtisii]NMW43656.1 exodeoxyribonuclease VII small subunit [Mobiluncus curtisii]NMW45792.1 exodeoxyribonuclease VII small subunit [Mobiluncus curtisii]
MSESNPQQTANPADEAGTGVSGNEDVTEMSYEAARAELIETVQALENAEAPLEDTLKLWDRGEALASRCQAILDSATARLAERQAQ